MKSFVTKKKYLFLHLGPGGDSSLERIRLEQNVDQIDFWDQPILEGGESTFENLVAACSARYDSLEYTGIIGHSFGCEIARAMIGQTKRPFGELIFLSPLHDLAFGFASFAENIGQSTSATALKEAILARLGVTSSPDEMEKFWAVIQAIVTDPAFPRAYWATEASWLEYVAILSRLTPLNMQMWQSGISDFLTNRREPQPADGVRSKSVFLGDKDPFYSDVQLEKKFWERLGYKVSVLPNVGHYTHIEGKVL